MTRCDRMSDRMPAVARGAAQWNTDEERHLNGCDACRLEWDLVLRTIDLGADADLVDDARITDAVLHRVRAAGVVAGRRRVWTWGGLAAAAALVLLVWRPTLRAPSSPMSAAPESLAVAVPTPLPTESITAPVETARLGLSVPELRDLSPDEVELIMESLDQPFRADELLESPTWVDGDGRGVVSGLIS